MAAQPGSVYPVLQQLEDEGLVRADESGERKLMALTDAGKEYVEERREALGTPWDTAAAGVSEDMMELRTLIGQVGAAVHEVARPAGPRSSTRRPRRCSRAPVGRSTGSSPGDDPDKA